MPAWLARTLPDGGDAGRVALHDAAGQALTADDVAAMVISAALDAQLAQAPTVDWEALRNTAIDWLVGQGLRYTDLPKLVGRVDAQRLQRLSSRHGETQRRDPAAVELLMPALQLDPGA